MNSFRRGINLIHFPLVFLSSLVALLLLISFVGPMAVRAAGTCPTSGNNITISTSCSFDAGTYNFTGTLTVNSGITVTANSNIGNAAVIINSDNILINGMVSANGSGFTATMGPGAGGIFSNSGGGGGYGGNGGFAPVGGATYGSATAPIDLGSGGGKGGSGSGGGAIKIAASGTLTVNGSVTANGTNGNFGGGSGGSVWLNAGTLAGTGMVTANGGTGFDNGGGGGGRVALTYTVDSSSFSAVSAFGSTGVGGLNGGAGTIFRKVAAATNGDLLIDNNNLSTSANTTQAGALSQTYDNVTIKNGAKYVIPTGFALTIVSGGALTGGGTVRPSITVDSGGTLNSPTATLTLSQLDVTNGGSFGVVTALVLTTSTFVHSGTFTTGLANLTVGSSAIFEFKTLTTLVVMNGVTIQNGGTLKHTANTTSQLFSINLSTQNFTVDVGGVVNANGAGFTVNNGPGAGGTFSNSGCGGGYGGVGGWICGGVTYGSATAPTDLGSGGGFTGAGSGGGAIKIAASGALTVNGSVTANGAIGNTGGGGSGGSVWLDAGTLTGIGAISANGGNSFNFGCGGGGRIALYASNFSHSGTVMTNSTCPNGVSGGAGTIVQQQTGDTTPPIVGAVAPTTTVVNTATIFSVIYSDDTGVHSCNFFADNVDQGMMILSAPGGTIGIATRLHTYTSSGTHTAQVKCKDVANNEGTNLLEVVTVVADLSPIITSVSHTPASPTSNDSVTLLVTATDDIGITKIEIYADGTEPANLKQTCNISPAQTTATCSVNVGAFLGGSHTTTVKAFDTAGNVSTGTETFVVVFVNNAPIANPDFYTMDEDTTLAVPAPGVFGNDTDAESDPLTAVLVTGPVTGVLMLNANGSFTYTPPPDFFGAIAFQYKAKDTANAESAPVEVMVTVNDVLDFTCPGCTVVSKVINPDGSITVTMIGIGKNRTYVTTLPAGAKPISPSNTVVFTIDDTNAKRAKFKVGAALPASTSKTMTVPRGTGNRACVQDVSGGAFNIGGGCPSANRVTIPLSGSSCTSPTLACSKLPSGATISTSADNTQVTVSGLTHSVVEVVGDTDGDGVDDDEDQCPNDVGPATNNGCPSAIKVLFRRHTVQSGTHPGSVKTPVVGAVVNIYSKTAGSCAATIGISPKNYKTIYEGNLLNGSNDLDGPCLPDQSSTTDLAGSATIGVLPGDYIMISKDPLTNVFAGVSVGALASGQVTEKFIQVIVRADGTAVSAKTTQNSGSVLYTIEPEYIDWNGTEQLYPYVFDSEGAWDVAVNITPPYGFTADYNSLSSAVNSEYKALQFTLTNTGSCWECGLDTEVTVTHEGKINKWKSNVRSDISEEYAKKKGLNSHELEKKGVVVTGKGHGGAKKNDKN